MFAGGIETVQWPFNVRQVEFLKTGYNRKSQ